MLLLQTFLLLLFSITLVKSLDIKGIITATADLPSPALLPPSTLLLLSAPGRQYQTHPSPKGEFIIRNVTSGPSYLLEIECLTHLFPSLRIDTAGDEVEVYQTFRGNEWSHKGPKLEYPIYIAPSSKANYYAPQGGFRLDAIFKNPMILLGIFSLAMVFIVPRLTASLDPEALEEYRKQQRAEQAQKAAQGPQLPSFDFASYMAGTSSPATKDKKKK